MTRTIERRSSSLKPALWLAAGAAGGILLGLTLATRTGGGRKLWRRLERLLGTDDADRSDDANDADDAETADADEVRVDERVLAAFENDPVLAERAIEIDEPEPGAIVLTGRVPTSRDADHAVTIARGTPGVTSVDNLLRVRSRPRR